jgi:1,4-alpha-glucan branching enzyme
MLYLDYSREEGQWIPNKYGGNENLEAISFLKEFNEAVYNEFPDTTTIAEESTAWKGVSRPTYTGGLGFGQKWMMGWMHDTLDYFKNDPVHRSYHHNSITFSLVYAFTENFMLPLSHDEVVHGKGSLMERMPGDEWQRFANLRALYTYMFTHPGTQLLFMGGEFGQTSEWNFEKGLAWDLLEYDYHKGVQNLIRDLNELYKNTPALYEKQFEDAGFEWIDISDYKNSVLSYVRKGKDEDKAVLVICNLTPVPRSGYELGIPFNGTWKEILNSDASEYGGTGDHKNEKVKVIAEELHGRDQKVALNLPPLGVVVLEGKAKKKRATSSKKKTTK